jgi:PAS domain S-box-containing protein
VTDQKKSPDKEIQYQALIDAFTSNIAILDQGNVIIAVNRAWQKTCAENAAGLASSKIGDNYLTACKKTAKRNIEEASLVVEAIKSIQKGECRQRIIEYSETGSRSNHWYQIKIATFLYDEGRLIVIHQDITERKAAEKNLHENERLFRGIIDQASEGITIIDEEGRIIEWNPAQEKNTGRSRDSVLGRYLWEIQYESRADDVQPQIKDLMQKMVLDLLKNGETSWMSNPYEVEIKKADGSRAIIESVVFPIPHNGGYYACSLTRDVTQIKESHYEQEMLKTRLENYVDYSPVIAFIVTNEGKFVDVNPEARKRLGYVKEEFLKMSMTDLIFPEDLKNLIHLFDQLQTSGSLTTEFRIRRKDMTELTFSANAVVLPDGNSMILCNDITDLKDSQKKLQESESFLSTILDNIPSAITVKDAEKLTYHKVNALMEKILNKTNEELLGKTAHDVFPKDEADFFEEQDRLAIERKGFVETSRFISKVKTLEGHTLHHKKVPILDESGKPKHILTIADDITNQVKLEEEAKAQLTRLESISKLSTSLQTVPDVNSLMPVFLNITVSVASADLGCVWLHKAEKNELVPVYTFLNDHHVDLMDCGTIRRGEGIPGKVYVEQTSFLQPIMDLTPGFQG